MHTFHAPDRGLATVGFLGGWGETRRCKRTVFGEPLDEYQKDGLTLLVPSAQQQNMAAAQCRNHTALLQDGEDPSPGLSILLRPDHTLLLGKAPPKADLCNMLPPPTAHLPSHRTSQHSLSTLPYIKETNSKDPLQSTGNSAQHSLITSTGQNLKMSRFMYVHIWVTFLSAWNQHSTVDQVYSNIKFKRFKKTTNNKEWA